MRAPPPLPPPACLPAAAGGSSARARLRPPRREAEAHACAAHGSASTEVEADELWLNGELHPLGVRAPALWPWQMGACGSACGHTCRLSVLLALALCEARCRAARPGLVGAQAGAGGPRCALALTPGSRSLRPLAQARYAACVAAVRELAQDRHNAEGELVVAKGDWPKYKARHRHQ